MTLNSLNFLLSWLSDIDLVGKWMVENFEVSRFINFYKSKVAKQISKYIFVRIKQSVRNFGFFPILHLWSYSYFLVLGFICKRKISQLHVLFQISFHPNKRIQSPKLFGISLSKMGCIRLHQILFFLLSQL